MDGLEVACCAGGRDHILALMGDDGTIIGKDAGIVECRICGLNFLPALEEDRERHEREHLRILAGGLPYEIREFLKRVGWEILENEDLRETPEHLETVKRAVAFAYRKNETPPTARAAADRSGWETSETSPRAPRRLLPFRR